MSNIPPTGPGANANIQPPEDDNEKENQSKNAEPEHRPQTKLGRRLKGPSLVDRARGIKQTNSGGGSIIREAKKNDPDQSQDAQTAGDD